MTRAWIYALTLSCACSEAISEQSTQSTLYALQLAAARSRHRSSPRASKETAQLIVVLRTHADRQLALARNSTWSAPVQQLLAASDVRALPTVDGAAQALGLSRSTLTRRLRCERVGYSTLLNERRRGAAQALLGLPHTSVPDVAEAVGYADACAFHNRSNAGPV